MGTMQYAFKGSALAHQTSPMLSAQSVQPYVSPSSVCRCGKSRLHHKPWMNYLWIALYFTVIVFFFLKHLYWGIIALQWCVSFCFITKWISYTYTYVPICLPSCVSLPPTLPIPPLQAVTKHRANIPVPCGCFPLAIYLTTFVSVYMSMTLSRPVKAHPSPSPYPQVRSPVGLRLYSCLTPRFFMTFFFPLNSIYMC